MYSSFKAAVVFLVVFVAFSEYMQVGGIISLQRWCNVSSSTSSGTLVQYNDSHSSCVRCNNFTKLFTNRNSPSNEKCCSGGFQQVCSECVNPSSCKNGNQYCAEQSCNSVNDCGDGTDELYIVSCKISNCELDQFSCNGTDYPQCFDISKFCDGQKHCFDGLDETGCSYYLGTCSGFLCTDLPQCIDKAMICDGKKDCLDGTDESNCLPSLKTFACSRSPAATVDMTKVCDGREDCASGGLDEVNCYFWTPWGAWTTCDCQQNTAVTRTRKCVTVRTVSSDHTAGKCTGEVLETNSCSCPPSTTPSDFLTLIVVIALVAVIVVVGASCVTYLCCASRKKQAKAPARPGGSLTANHQHQQPMVNQPLPPNGAGALPPGKNLTIRYAPSQKSPAMSYQSQSSVLAVTPARSIRVAHSSTSSPIPPPLPSRRESLTDVGYSTIKEAREEIIDPYAQTRPVAISGGEWRGPRHPGKFGSTNSLLLQRHDPDFPARELGPAPNAPLSKRSKSMELLESDGYLVPTRSQRINNTRKGNYTEMTSPEKYSKLRASPGAKGKGYTKVVKKPNSNTKAKKAATSRAVQKSTSFSYSSAHDAAKVERRNSTARSETYAFMRRRLEEENEEDEEEPRRDAHDTLMNSIGLLQPPATEAVDAPVRSPPHFKPPSLSSSLNATPEKRAPREEAYSTTDKRDAEAGGGGVQDAYDHLFNVAQRPPEKVAGEGSGGVMSKVVVAPNEVLEDIDLT